jgi:predicted DNA-binding protein YlxM (UPF0122 family)
MAENIDGCYGREFEHHEKCKPCKYRKYCKDARDLQFSYRDKSYSDALEIVAEEKCTEKNDNAGILAEFTCRLLQACDRNGVRLAVVMARLCGLPYSEIGRQFKITRQAIHKHVRAVSMRIAELGRMLKEKPVIASEIRDELESCDFRIKYEKLLKEDEKLWQAIKMG